MEIAEEEAQRGADPEAGAVDVFQIHSAIIIMERIIAALGHEAVVDALRTLVVLAIEVATAH